MGMTALGRAVNQSKAVLFDLFHTLAAIASSWAGGLPGTSENLGVDREAWDEQLHLHARRRLSGQDQGPFHLIGEMARAIDPAIPDETLHRAVQNRIVRFEAALLDVPSETTAVLETLRARGKKLGLISNADAVEVAAWDRSPLAQRFDAAILSCRVGVVKPEPEIYALCLERLDVGPHEAIYVGDGSSFELQGARAAGMTTVLMTGIIQDLWPERVEERKAHADFVIERLSQLVDA